MAFFSHHALSYIVIYLIYCHQLPFYYVIRRAAPRHIIPSKMPRKFFVALGMHLHPWLRLCLGQVSPDKCPPDRCPRTVSPRTNAHPDKCPSRQTPLFNVGLTVSTLKTVSKALTACAFPKDVKCEQLCIWCLIEIELFLLPILLH